LAHYALALICSSDEDDRKQISPYWYTQAQQGHALTNVQSEWADTWISQQAKAEKHIFHLREAARLGNMSASFDLAEQFGDPAFFDTAADSVDVDPVRVAEVAEKLGRTKDAKRWLIVAAEAGDTYAMRVLIDEYEHDNLQQCWTWLHLAHLVGTDLTLDDHYAINEDGSDYDDDIGGPCFVGGTNGVTLDPLTTEQNVAALQVAHELLEKIRKVIKNPDGAAANLIRPE
jgi:TPR repeat protein